MPLEQQIRTIVGQMMATQAKVGSYGQTLNTFHTHDNVNSPAIPQLAKLETFATGTFFTGTMNTTKGSIWPTGWGFEHVGDGDNIVTTTLTQPFTVIATMFQASGAAEASYWICVLDPDYTAPQFRIITRKNDSGAVHYVNVPVNFLVIVGNSFTT